MNIDILGNRFLGMFKEQSENGTVLRLEIDFKSKINGLKWNIFNKNIRDNEDSLIIVIPKNETNEIYHVLGMESIITFDDLIEHSKQIIDFNMEIEEKKLLLKGKIEELGELFTKHPIEELRKMKFVLSETKTTAKSFSSPATFGEKNNKKEKQTKKKKVVGGTNSKGVEEVKETLENLTEI
jgi:hypothetical protein